MNNQRGHGGTASTCFNRARRASQLVQPGPSEVQHLGRPGTLQGKCRSDQFLRAPQKAVSSASSFLRSCKRGRRAKGGDRHITAAQTFCRDFTCGSRADKACGSKDGRHQLAPCWCATTLAHGSTGLLRFLDFAFRSGLGLANGTHGWRRIHGKTIATSSESNTDRASV